MLTHAEQIARFRGIAESVLEQNLDPSWADTKDATIGSIAAQLTVALLLEVAIDEIRETNDRIYTLIGITEQVRDGDK